MLTYRHVNASWLFAVAFCRAHHFVRADAPISIASPDCRIQRVGFLEPRHGQHGQRGIADRQAVRVACYRGYGMSVRECLCHQLFADSAGRSEYGDVHLARAF